MPLESNRLFGESVVGELTYYMASSTTVAWQALVLQMEEGGDKKLRLYIQASAMVDHQFSGDFINGKALVKYVRAKAKEHFPGMEPGVDTLGRLASRTASSVVPTCYGTGGECLIRNCPYIDECQTVQWKSDASEVSLREEVVDDTALLRRLKTKLANKTWED